MTVRFMRKPVQHEKIEQQHCVRLYQSVGAKVYVLGTRRRQRCHECGAVTRDQGTRQTPGIADLEVHLPAPPLRTVSTGLMLKHEVKVGKNTRSDDQDEYADHCQRSGVPCIVGGLDAAYHFLLDGGWLKPENVPHYRLPTEAGARHE